MLNRLTVSLLLKTVLLATSLGCDWDFAQCLGFLGTLQTANASR